MIGHCEKWTFERGESRRFFKNWTALGQTGRLNWQVFVLNCPVFAFQTVQFKHHESSTLNQDRPLLIFQIFRMPKKKINSKTRFPVFKKNSNWLTLVPNSLKDLLTSSKPPLTVFLNLSWTRNWTTETFLKNLTKLWTTWCPCNKFAVRDDPRAV